MVTLLLALVITIALEGFLSFLTTEYRMVHRTYSYGSGIYLAEAGVEEGIAMVNNGNAAWGANGWSSLGSNSYTKTVTGFTSASGDSIGNYTVNVLNSTNTNPTIICTGAVDTASSSLASTSITNVTRAVKAILGKRALFQWGLLAQSTIDLKGNNVSVDSFDSSTSTYSDYDGSKGFGLYDSGKRKDNGDVATNAGLTNTISVGNADIYGHVATGSGGTATVGANGFVAALGAAVNGVIDSNRVSHSMNVDLPAATLPTDFNAVATYTITGAKTLGTGGTNPVDYNINSIGLNGSSDVLTISGYVRIYVTGGTSVTGNGKIVLNADAKLEIYAKGTTNIAGKGMVNNDGRSYNFQLYQLDSNSVSISGNGQFTGVVYAPQSALSISGGGSTGIAVGAFVGNTITLNGHVDFHYDEDLKNKGPSRGYSILAWQEL